ncbi:hypothetical protein [Fusobacterium polymorphum]|nr:hypothetical protein [Fusobacterium polymorphum]
MSKQKVEIKELKEKVKILKIEQRILKETQNMIIAEIYVLKNLV